MIKTRHSGDPKCTDQACTDQACATKACTDKNQGGKMILLQVSQRVQDLERAAAFYEELLGTPPTALFDPPGLLFFNLAGVRLLLEKSEHPEEGTQSSLLYLKLPDVRDEVERLRSKGVDVLTEPHVIFSHSDGTLGPAGTDEWHAFIRDSEGNTVGLASQLPSD